MKKIKTSSLSSKQEAELAVVLKESRFFDLISRHGSNLIYLIIAALVLLLVVYKMTSSSKTKAENDYYNADQYYDRLKKDIGLSDAFNQDIVKLQEIIHRHPELHAKYDGSIAQLLIFQRESEKAKEFADLAFKRTKNEESPFYIDYSENTLLISAGQYQQALTNAKNLNQKMLADPKERNNYSTLYVMNLIRLAMLEQQAGAKKDELLTWQDLQQYAKQNPSRELKVLMTSFSEGKISLNDYIDARKK